jgi:probable F420-dependent oxidoreductase
MGRPLRVGCVAFGPAPTRAEWRARVRRVDELGFDLLSMPDHLGWWPPFAPLVAAADVSDRLRFGVQVLNVEFWNPALLAREAAAVDVLTDGRLELGFGAGHAEVEFRAAGLRYPRPAERVDHLRAAVPLVRRLLAGETVTADGPYPLDDCAIGLTTAQSPVPIMVGGNGNRVLDVAGREADIVGLVGFTSGTGQHHTDMSHFDWDGLADRVAHVRTAAGARADALELSVLVQAVVVTDDRRAAADELAARFGVPAGPLLDSPFVMLGSPDSLAEHVRRLVEHGVTAVTMFEPFTAGFGPVLERLR